MIRTAIIFGFLFLSCNNTNQNQIDIQKIKKGMHHHNVQRIMTHKYYYSTDNIYKQTIPVFVNYYRAPFGSSGDIEIWYRRRDSTVVTAMYGD